MNNLSLGDGEFSYYETLGGGQGACADADGPSAVHVAMSNTLNTPIEALEHEFPLRVTEYALRRGSGGAGAPPRRRRPRQGTRGTHGDELLADRRAPPPRAPRGRRAAGPGRPGATCSTASAIAGQDDRHHAARAAAAHRNPRWGRIRGWREHERLSGSASSASGSWARGWPPTWPGRAMSCRLDPHPRQGRGVGGRARRAAPSRRRPRWPRRATSSISMVVDGGQVQLDPARRGRRDRGGPRRDCCASTCRRSRRPTRRRIGAALAERARRCSTPR